MSDVASFVRIFEPTPSDEFVTKRIAAVKDLTAKYGKLNSVDPLLQLANDLAAWFAPKGAPAEALAADVEAALKKQSTSFVAEGQDLQMLTCAALAVVEFLEAARPSSGGMSAGDVIASALWSALSFQPPRAEPKLEELRQELLSKARRLVLGTAVNTRERMKVPPFKEVKPETEDWSDFGDKLKAATGPTIDAMLANAALDREELDLLWWALSERSSILGRRYAGLPEGTAAVASGLEAAKLLRRLPSDGHRNLVYRNVGDGGARSVTALFAELAADREPLGVAFTGNSVNTCPAVFPLLNGLRSGAPTGGDDRVLSLADWAARALLEGAIVQVASLNPVAKL